MTYAERLGAWHARQTRELIRTETPEIVSAEVRDPRAATQQLSYVSPGQRQIPEWDADSAIREAYLSSVIVYACVRTIAYAFAGCPLRAVLPGRDIAEHDPNAPLARLLGPPPGGPNPNLAARRLWAGAVTSYIVTGKIAWELELPEGALAGTNAWMPVRIWPLVAASLRPIPTDGGIALFSAFKYGRYDREYTYQPDQVYYSFEPSQRDPRQAASPLQALRYDVTADVLQSVYDVAFLRNDARPAGIIVTPGFASDDERQRFRQQWDSQFRGPANANRIKFMESEDGDPKAALAFQQLGLSQRDSMSLLSQRDKVMRVCMGLGVPLSLLDASARTFANAGMEERNFWLNTMLPTLEFHASEINLKLAPRLGPHVAMFDTRHVESLKAPAKFASISIGEAVDRKIAAVAEARNELGFTGDLPPEMPAAPTMTEQAQMVTALGAQGWSPEDIAAIIGIAPPTQPVTPKAPTLSVLPPPDTSLTSAEAQTALRSLRHALSRVERRRSQWRLADAQTRGQEKAWVRAMRRLFARQRSSTIKRLNERARRWSKRQDDVNPDDVYDPTYWHAETEAVVEGLYDTLYAMAGSRAASAVGVGFDVTDPLVQARIAYRVSLLAERVTQTTYDAIRSVILSGLEAGSDIPTIAQGIEAVFDEADSDRATLIARTETIAASNDAALAAYEQAGDALAGWRKEWIAELDDRTDDECEQLDGETVGFDEAFSTGDQAPPLHPNCLLGSTRVVVPGDEAIRLASGNSVVALREVGASATATLAPPRRDHASAGVRATVERQYVGDVVAIELSSGYELTGTPNHPIATPGGWVPLAELAVGDDVLCSIGQEWGLPSDDDVDHVPPTLQEIAEALPVRAAGVPVAAEDFHGDGSGSEVCVVRADGPLRDHTQAALSQHLGQEQLGAGDIARTPLHVESASQQPGLTVGNAADSIVSGLRQSLTFGHGGLSHSLEHGGAAIAAGDVGRKQPAGDHVAADAEGFCQRLLALTAEITTAKVVRRRNTVFAGHVYNLETPGGWYIANGIVTHNCRCTIGAVETDASQSAEVASAEAATLLRAVVNGTIRSTDLEGAA